ncbi:DHS-like NAD/FAD-binding domain-containing protein [Mycotypha africana]|uniref:DHS-like NAD/FAD-binding domain-containing protein n=1 Tax=Mycotypha africana TaxID=64632 RepID=UPI0022FFE0B2|nr:DHS-like NAD/FAD-binding domain-containing protein [Mycotypha africana]KAI8987422.1 DHS-like NAD/FAD-binding domain-containing protein [Mycotypha africana]
MPKTRQSRKAQLEDSTIEAVAKYIKEKDVKNIIVMSGAGISTAAGIPDFRSKETGLYHNLQKFDLPYAEAVFDIDYFVERPEPFYALAKELYPGKYLPTKTHYFVKLLHEKGLLLRNFTQNIDTLERMTGLDDKYIIEAHGSFATASCVECKTKADSHYVKENALKGQVPRCKECDQLIKPDITFFGENLPKKFFKHLTDFECADLLIVIGTSLQVQPFASLIDRVPDFVPRLLINRELAGVHHSKSSGFDFKWQFGLNRDAVYLGSCDDGVEKLTQLLGWEKDLERLFMEGHNKLKAIWKAEHEAALATAAAEKAEEETEGVFVQEQDEDVDKLAAELEKLTAEEKRTEIKKEEEKRAFDGKKEDIESSAVNTITESKTFLSK